MTRQSPRPHGPWDAYRLTAAWGAAAALPLAATLTERGAAMLMPLTLALLLAVFWHAVFARLRRRPMAWDGIIPALVFAMLVPVAVPLWQQGLSFSFGLVLGGLVFGGRGRGFVSPVVVGLSFLLLSFPDIAPAGPDRSVAIAAAVAGALAIAVGVLSWRIVTGFTTTAVLLALLWPLPEGISALWNASLVIGLVFLIGDPVAAACTNAGRWAHGVLAAALVMLFAHSTGGAIGLTVVVSAAFLASVFAPLIDHAVVWQNIRRRARRAGHG